MANLCVTFSKNRARPLPPRPGGVAAGVAMGDLGEAEMQVEFVKGMARTPMPEMGLSEAQIAGRR